MRVLFERSGGFAGRVLQKSLDLQSLSPEDARRLQELLERSGFFQLPSNLENPRSGADRFTYRLTVETENGTRTIEAGEGAITAGMRPLIDWLTRFGRHCIVPPYLLRSIAKNGNARQQATAWATLTDSEQFRGQRRILSALVPLAATPINAKRRTIYDAGNTYDLPGRRVRGEGDPKIKDPAVNEAYDGLGATYNMYARVFGRKSIDGRGMRLDASVHYGVDYDNAFWDGHQMVFGDGDGEIFRRFTVALDVIGHELTHGVTQCEAGLNYLGQPGALNESFSDVFGSLIKQFKLGQSAEEASWLIGENLFVRGIKAKAIRSMKAPGTAYDDPVLGKDPQPGHMRDYVVTDQDNGGVHINSGIPNRAFYEVAVRLKGNAWEKAGQIWYKTLIEKLRPTSNFPDAMTQTVRAAGEIFGSGSMEQKAVRVAWSEVGI